MNITPREEYVPLTPPAFHVLLALAEKPMYIYGVVKQCQFDTESTLNFDRPNTYRTIGRLTKLGLVEISSQQYSQGSPHLRTYYQLTPAGRTILEWECNRYQSAANLGKLRLAKAEKNETIPV
jgi:PadR family transcriptional regulator, regulatory protein PadR